MRDGVFFLDDDDSLREAVAELFRLEARTECLPLASVEDLMKSRERVLQCRLGILDINLGPGVPSGIDAYRWLEANGFRGRIVFLTGHAQSHPLVRQAHDLGVARIYEKPVPVPDLLSWAHEAGA